MNVRRHVTEQRPWFESGNSSDTEAECDYRQAHKCRQSMMCMMHHMKFHNSTVNLLRQRRRRPWTQPQQQQRNDETSREKKWRANSQFSRVFCLFLSTDREIFAYIFAFSYSVCRKNDEFLSCAHVCFVVKFWTNNSFEISERTCELFWLFSSISLHI